MISKNEADAQAPRRTQGSSRRRLLGGALGFAALAVTAAACGKSGSGGPENTTLRFFWWGGAGRAEATKKAVGLFEQANPAVKVEAEFADYGPYWDRMSTLTAGGNAPDIVQFDIESLLGYASKGVLLDLAPFESNRLKLNDLSESLVAAGRVDGKLYGVPFGDTTQSIIYNKAALQQIGVTPPSKGMTWDQFGEWARQVRVKSGGKLHGATDMAWHTMPFEVWLRQHGKALYEGKSFGFVADDLRQFWDMWNQWRKTGASTSAEITAQVDGTPAHSPLVLGKSVADFHFANFLPDYGTATKSELALAPVPSGGQGSGMYNKPSVLLCVTSASRNRDKAVDLLNFLINDPKAGEALGVSRGRTPNKKIRQSLLGGLQPAQRQVFEYQESVEPIQEAPPKPYPQGHSKILRAFGATYQKMIFGKLSLDNAVQEFLDRASQELR